jgi:hypothetical protein
MESLLIEEPDGTGREFPKGTSVDAKGFNAGLVYKQ